MGIAAVEERAFLRTIGVDVLSSSESEPGDSSASHEDVDCIPEDTVKTESHDKIQRDPHAGPNKDPDLDVGPNKDPDPDAGPNKDSDLHAGPDKEPGQSLTLDHLALLLQECNFNWFVFVDELMIRLRQYDTTVIEKILLDFEHNMAFMDFTIEEERSIEQSRQAYLIRCQEQAADLQDGRVLTDLESDNPEEWLSLRNLNSQEGIEMIK